MRPLRGSECTLPNPHRLRQDSVLIVHHHCSSSSPAPGQDLLLQAALDAGKEAQVVCPGRPVSLSPSVSRLYLVFFLPLPSSLPTSICSIFPLLFRPCTLASCPFPLLLPSHTRVPFAPAGSSRIRFLSYHRIRQNEKIALVPIQLALETEPTASTPSSRRSQRKRSRRVPPPPRPSPTSSGTPPDQSRTHGRPRPFPHQ